MKCKVCQLEKFWPCGDDIPCCECKEPSCNSRQCPQEQKAENDVNKTIGQRIQELRKAAGMTQLQLADKCGMAQPNIARIENGAYATSIDVLSRIAEALGKRIELV